MYDEIKRTYTFVLVMAAIGCTQEYITVNKIDSNSPAGSINLGQEGASSGGGGLSQKTTKELLDIAKLELAESIEAMPEKLFANFPSEFKQKQLIRIIENIKFLPEVESRVTRHGSYLKLNYDKNSKTLVALYDFYLIYNGPSLLELAKEPRQFKKTITNIQKDILHELSHLLGIGTTEETDFSSYVFANYFLEGFGAYKHECESDIYKMRFFPYEKVMFINNKKHDLQYLSGDVYLQELLFRDESLDSVIIDYI